MEYTLGEIEMRFANLIWQNEPITSGALVKLCELELNWKKSTTYTILRRLCERGLFLNKDGVVTSLISKERFNTLRSEEFVEENFSGSLPRFLAAFTANKKLSREDIEEIRRLIDNIKE